MNRKSTISLILFWMTAFVAALVLPLTGFTQTYTTLNSKVQICQTVRIGGSSFNIDVGDFVYGPPPEYMRVLFPLSTSRRAAMAIGLASADTGVGITLRYGQAPSGSVAPQNHFWLPPDTPIRRFAQMAEADLGINISAGGSVSHSIFHIGSQQGELLADAGEWLYVHITHGRQRIGSISYVFSVDRQATLDWCEDRYSTITVTANPVEGGQVEGGGNFISGTSITVKATPNPDYTFTKWTESGTEVSTEASYTFSVTASRTLVANFQSLNSGSLKGTIEPEGAREDGAQWRRTGTSDWIDSDTAEDHVSQGEHTVEFKDVEGWIKPRNQRVSIDTGQVTEFVGKYKRPLTGVMMLLLEEDGNGDE